MSTDTEIEEPENATETPPAKGKPGKKKLLIIAGALATVLVGGGGGAYVVLGTHKAAAPGEGGEKHASAHGEGEEAADFIDVPAMIVNLRSADGAPRLLKVHFMLVPAPGANAEEVKKKLPLLLDAYQPFLRELRPEDLAGSAAVFRIKEEMMVRAAAAYGNDQITDVLIQDLIQQ